MKYLAVQSVYVYELPNFTKYLIVKKYIIVRIA